MNDLISKEDVIRALWKINDEYDSVYFTAAIHRAVDVIEKMPSAEVKTQMSSADCISRQAAIDDLYGKDPSQIWDTADIEVWINALPSAEPEIIRCKDCAKRKYCRTVPVWAVVPDDDWYCAYAERRTDG